MKSLIVFFILIHSVLAANLGMIGEQFIFSGPNCHNTAFRAAGIMNFRRYIREDEMRDILRNQCQRISKNSDSIGVIHVGPTKTPMHTFVLIDEDSNRVLTKNGVSKREGVIEQGYDEMMYIHESAIVKNCKMKNIPERDCLINVRYYNCKKLDGTEIENLLDQAYEIRETIFNPQYQNLISEALEQTNQDQLVCSRYKSIFQSLEIMNWNSLGPLEYESMKLFIASIKEKFDPKFCSESLGSPGSL